MAKHNRWLPQTIIAVFVLSYLLITLAALFSTHHILYNLEPYPDGILYALSARNFALGKGFHLVYEGNITPVWVPPLYSSVLIPFYIALPPAQTFYLANSFLGAATITLLFYLLWKCTKSVLSSAAAVVFYLSHALIFWLPTVPMTENLTPLLLIAALMAIFIEKPSKFWIVVSALAAVGLGMTRYAAVPITLVLLALLTQKILFINKNKLLFQLGAVAALLLLALELTPFKPLTTLIQQGSHIFLQGMYYNVRFIVPNSISYIQSLMGISHHFLWLQTPLTTGFLLIPCLVFWLYNIIKGSQGDRFQAWALLLIFLSQFPLLLIFYSVDERYAILCVPLLAITGGLLHARYVKNFFGFTSGIFFGIVLLQLIMQRSLYQEIIANNILHHSRAWQYESIQQFNQFFAQHPRALVITALPPHLVDAYQTTSYQLLPLSKNQEFLHKGEWVWKQTYQSENLESLYTKLLKEGQELYITNAYITHQQTVTNDFERYKTLFNIEEVKQGCLSACNIYKLSLISN